MKKSLLIALLLIGSFTGRSQSYSSIFAQDTTKWTIIQEIIDAALTRSYKTIAGIDSSLNGTVYKKVFQYTNDLTGLIREDVSNGRLWYYSFNSNREKLIMDLSLQLNDTFYIQTIFVSDSIPVIADSIYSVGTAKHIRFNFLVFSGQSKFEFIEGVGPNAGIAYQGQSFGWNHISHQLLCKFNDTAQIYTNTDYNGDCYVDFMDIEENLINNEVVAFPNPVRRNEWLSFSTKHDLIQSVSLFDLTGNYICEFNSSHISISQPAGIYYAEVIGYSGNRYRKKIIIVE